VERVLHSVVAGAIHLGIRIDEEVERLAFVVARLAPQAMIIRPWRLWAEADEWFELAVGRDPDDEDL